MNKDTVKLELNIQQENLRVLQSALENINSVIQSNGNLDNSNKIIELLREAKENLDLVRSNIGSLEKLEKYLDADYPEKIDKIELEYLLSTVETDIRTFYSNFNKFVYDYIGSTSFATKQPKTFVVTENIEQPLYNKEIAEPINAMQQDSAPENSNNLSTSDGDNNILLISKLRNKVFLPYKMKDLASILSKSRKYKDLQEIINDKYTIPIDNFRNPTISRFKEAYNLMRKKEKASIMDSIDLGLDVAFNSKLYPAVITACRNLEELDTYLDYLELNQLDKFDAFKVEYEFYPTAH